MKKKKHPFISFLENWHFLHWCMIVLTQSFTTALFRHTHTHTTQCIPSCCNNAVWKVGAKTVAQLHSYVKYDSKSVPECRTIWIYTHISTVHPFWSVQFKINAFQWWGIGKRETCACFLIAGVGNLSDVCHLKFYFTGVLNREDWTKAKCNSEQ